MASELFILAVTVLAALLLTWGFRSLPNEEWQIMASVPIAKDASGQWQGLNLTYYGALSATAHIAGVVVICVLMGAVGVPPRGTLILVVTLLAICLPASRLVARLVEKKRYGLTVGGGAFAGLLVVPWVILIVNRIAGPLTGIHLPATPALAALSIGYAFGEGVGRLSCVSFGCCYGKPLSQIRPWLRKPLERYSFVFTGKTKKIAYESGLDGEKVVPVQGITAILYVGAALAAADLFLHAHHVAAACVSLVVTQGWRSVSETLRADYRGSTKISPYQVMSIVGIPYLVLLLLIIPVTPTAPPNVAAGLSALWDPGSILLLQVLWIGIFLYTGRSMVTGSTLNFYVHRERI